MCRGIIHALHVSCLLMCNWIFQYDTNITMNEWMNDYHNNHLRAKSVFIFINLVAIYEKIYFVKRSIQWAIKTSVIECSTSSIDQLNKHFILCIGLYSDH